MGGDAGGILVGALGGGLVLLQPRVGVFAVVQLLGELRQPERVEGVAHHGELGNDTIDGGSGRDWLDYFDAPAGVRVSLAKGTATGGAGADTFRSIEAVFGSEHADTLIGGPRSDRLEGSRGNDRLYGGGGKDTLLGESGRDRADGGPARDICRAERMVHCP